MFYMLVFAPGFDAQFLQAYPGHVIDEPFGKLQVSYQGDVEVHSLSSQHIIIGEFFFIEAFGNIDDQVQLQLLDVGQRIGLFFLERPGKDLRRNAVILHKIGRPPGGKKLEPKVYEPFCLRQKYGFALERASGQHDVFFLGSGIRPRGEL